LLMRATHLRIASIAGRREDILRLPAKNGGTVDVHAFLLGETLLHLPEVRQYQLSPRAGGPTVTVVLREGIPPGVTLRSVGNVIEAELDRIGARVESLAIEAVEEIERVGGGAKEKLVSALV